MKLFRVARFYLLKTVWLAIALVWLPSLAAAQAPALGDYVLAFTLP